MVYWNPLYIPVTIGAFFGMEIVARLMHKYLMHGILWSLHKDHHINMGHKIQRNNIFGAIFAVVSIFLFIETFKTGDSIFAFAGIGMALYGLAYWVVHDMLIHNYRPHLGNRKFHGYLGRLVEVHRLHHVQDGKGKGINWGFVLYLPRLDRTAEDVRKKGFN